MPASILHAIDVDDNEVEVLEIIHHFVEILRRNFDNVTASMCFVLWITMICLIYYSVLFWVLSLISLGMKAGFDIQFPQGNLFHMLKCWH